MENWSFEKFKRPTENWPLEEDGNPVKPVFLQHLSGGPLDTELTVNLLEAFGIPLVTIYPNNGDFAKVVMGYPATGIDLYVPQTMFDDAVNILSADIVEDTE